MRIHEQNFDGPFSEVINQWLQNTNGGSFTGISAFAKVSGVGLIEESLRDFKKRGGKVIFIVGIDLDGTSYDALVNLFELSDELYVVHSENNITFHPKMYLLDSPEFKAIAVGSNNLTAGGLYNNIEASQVTEGIEADSELYQNYCVIRNRFTEVSDDSVMKINSVEDIVKLLESGYIETEQSIIRKRISDNKKDIHGKQSSSQNKKFFGRKQYRRAPKSTPNLQKNHPSNDTRDMKVNNGEFTWFETGQMTGGSRNILDLSTIGTLVLGDPSGTVYYNADNEKLVKGGTIFFGVDPNLHNHKKDITIKYDGKSYFPATIVYTQGNKNWRLQIKGKNSLKEKITENLKESLVDKILVFEKIDSNNYTLMILDKEAKPDLINQSLFYARNGKNKPTGRSFGYITNQLEV